MRDLNKPSYKCTGLAYLKLSFVQPVVEYIIENRTAYCQTELYYVVI
jgi:hypothetical protein